MSAPTLTTARPAPAELRALYEAVGWTTYTRDPELIGRALDASSYVVAARCDGALAGLARCISDDAVICYVQDVLVHPDHQRRGIGRLLIEDCLARYAHCRQKVLLTDDRADQAAFYRSLGFTRSDEVPGAVLRAFVRFGT